jgi:hypothetical protein
MRFASGSMVYFDRLFVVFTLYERENDEREKVRTALPKAQSSNCIRSNTVYAGAASAGGLEGRRPSKFSFSARYGGSVSTKLPYERQPPNSCHFSVALWNDAYWPAAWQVALSICPQMVLVDAVFPRLYYSDSLYTIVI